MLPLEERVLEGLVDGSLCKGVDVLGEFFPSLSLREKGLGIKDRSPPLDALDLVEFWEVRLLLLVGMGKVWMGGWDEAHACGLSTADESTSMISFSAL